VPLRCWAKASDETAIDNRESARKSLRIVFLHFGSGKSRSRTAFRHCRGDFVRWQAPRSAAMNKGQALANAAKFTTIPAHLITD
jgi:hypothetical protein